MAGASDTDDAFFANPAIDGDFDFIDDIGLNDEMFITRLDSAEVIYETKEIKAKMVGKYLKGDTLGEGSYSKVVEFLDTKTLCRRAAKIMKRMKLRKIPNGEANVKREICLLRRLDHENVIKLVDFFENPVKQKLYAILELCVCCVRDLLTKTNGNRLPLWQSHLYFIQLLDGLDYLHSQGVIHKDIKPDNLLLTHDHTLKITDFGVAELLDLYRDSDSCTTSQGTPMIQPPEIAIGVESFSGYKVDSWCAGVTLYKLTSGHYPFESVGLLKLFEAIAKCEYTVPQHLVEEDPILVDLVKAILEFNPEKRLSIYQIKQHKWVRRKHVRISPMVPIPIKHGDPLLGTTVTPYLESLYGAAGSVNNSETSFGAITGGGPTNSDPVGPSDHIQASHYQPRCDVNWPSHNNDRPSSSQPTSSRTSPRTNQSATVPRRQPVTPTNQRASVPSKPSSRTNSSNCTAM